MKHNCSKMAFWWPDMINVKIEFSQESFSSFRFSLLRRQK